ncbi:unnamed protein product, partial [marine sediment metagenome]
MRKNLRSIDLFDEGIPAESPGEYCLYCGIPLETAREKREGFCGDHLKDGGKKHAGFDEVFQ